MKALLYYWQHYQRCVEYFDSPEEAVGYAWGMNDYGFGSPTLVEDLESGVAIRWDAHPHYDFLVEQERLARENRPPPKPVKAKIMVRPVEGAFGDRTGAVPLDHYASLDEARADLAILRAKIGDRAYIE